MSAPLKIINLSGGYDSQFTLADLSFEIKKNELVGLIGPNGSGKTTILRLISRILEAKQGEILIQGQRIKDLNRREVAKRVALVPQLMEPIEGLTVEEMVLMGRYPHLERFYRENQKDRQIVKWAMEQTGVLEFVNRDLTALSGGEFQRVIMARALAQEPKLLLLDEPTAHLDIRYQLEVLDLLKQIVRQNSVAILATFHDLNLAANYCKRLILLKGGKIVAQGLPEEVLTEENIAKTYGVKASIERDPDTSRIHFNYLKDFGGNVSKE